MSTPTVTALIDTYNHERFIEQAIVSVLEQDFPASEMEVLVVDDGSTDRTPEIVRKFAPRVKYLRKENGGQASAFNFGIPQAHGEFIAFLDGDDWWAPAKLSTLTEYFRQRPQIGVLGHGFNQVDSVTGPVTPTLPMALREMDFSSLDDTAFFRRMMCFFGTSRVVIRKEVAQRALPIPESIAIEADEFLSIVSIAHSRALLIPQVLTFYRLHENNLYQLRSADGRKLRRLYQSIAALARELPPRLAAASLSPEAIKILVGTLNNHERKLRLQLDGGSPWETFQVARAERGYNISQKPFAYRIFEMFSLGLTLLMPPRRFYQLQRWYGASRLRRWRTRLGEPVPAAKISAIVNSPAAPTQGQTSLK
jgi:glycosyltransferase involved in cell wall biosynthesis